MFINYPLEIHELICLELPYSDLINLMKTCNGLNKIVKALLKEKIFLKKAFYNHINHYFHITFENNNQLDNCCDDIFLQLHTTVQIIGLKILSFFNYAHCVLFPLLNDFPEAQFLFIQLNRHDYEDNQIAEALYFATSIFNQRKNVITILSLLHILNKTSLQSFHTKQLELISNLFDLLDPSLNSKFQNLRNKQEYIVALSHPDAHHFFDKIKKMNFLSLLFSFEPSFLEELMPANRHWLFDLFKDQSVELLINFYQSQALINATKDLSFLTLTLKNYAFAYSNRKIDKKTKSSPLILTLSWLKDLSPIIEEHQELNPYWDKLDPSLLLTHDFKLLLKNKPLLNTFLILFEKKWFNEFLCLSLIAKKIIKKTDDILKLENTYNKFHWSLKHKQLDIIASLLSATGKTLTTVSNLFNENPLLKRINNTVLFLIEIHNIAETNNDPTLVKNILGIFTRLSQINTLKSYIRDAILADPAGPWLIKLKLEQMNSIDYRVLWEIISQKHDIQAELLDNLLMKFNKKLFFPSMQEVRGFISFIKNKNENHSEKSFLQYTKVIDNQKKLVRLLKYQLEIKDVLLNKLKRKSNDNEADSSTSSKKHRSLETNSLSFSEEPNNLSFSNRSMR